MLTLKQITEDKEGIIRKLAKKLFDGKEPIENVIAVNETRKACRTQQDIKVHRSLAEGRQKGRG